MEDTDGVPIVPEKKSHHKKGPMKKKDTDNDKPFITFFRPPGGVFLSATS